MFTDWDTEHADDAYRRQVELAAQCEEERVQAEIQAELEAERQEAERKKAEEVAAEERRQRMLRKKAKKEQKVRLGVFESEGFGVLDFLMELEAERQTQSGTKRKVLRRRRGRYLVASGKRESQKKREGSLQREGNRRCSKEGQRK